MLDKLYQITRINLTFYQIDVKDNISWRGLLVYHKIDGIILFAELKTGDESVLKMLEYYYGALLPPMFLSKLCVKYGLRSLCLAYHQICKVISYLLYEEIWNLNPYGEMKAVNWWILTGTPKAKDNYFVSLLRYFNLVGAHERGLIGRNPDGITNNLTSFMTSVAKREIEKLNVLKNDHGTRSGTNQGTSVLELLNTFNEENNIDVPP